ncbi:hypothetical protein FJY71_00545 [candidate division WOR-3 bacterium]|nr:hypothetical protein [candidate division WOR-3 bacterium]
MALTGIGVLPAGRALRSAMVDFRRRLFPERRYRLPLRWVLLVLAAGLMVLVVWAGRRLLRW